MIFVLPFALMLSLGGYVLGSAVMAWAVIAPLGALWGGTAREAVIRVFAFLAAAVVSGLVEPLLRTSNGLPEWLRTAFFVLNLGIFMSVVVWLLYYFTLQKQRVLDVMRRARELESAYLQEEVTVRQNEKLATLGRLSAGLAHELNNPTAAVQRAARQLAEAWRRDRISAALAGLGLDAAGHRCRAPTCTRAWTARWPCSARGCTTASSSRRTTTPTCPGSRATRGSSTRCGPTCWTTPSTRSATTDGSTSRPGGKGLTRSSSRSRTTVPASRPTWCRRCSTRS